MMYSPDFYSSVSERAAKAATVASAILADVTIPVSLIDIGSGQGIWAQTFQEAFPSIDSITAIDFNANNINLLKENEKARISKISQDLAVVSSLPDDMYDLGICVEVLEHLPKNASERLILEFGKKCRLMIFSAALIGQGGTNHINEQSLSYWTTQMGSAGFVPFDVFRSKFVSDKEIPKYYSNSIALWINLNLITKETISFDKLLTIMPRNIPDIRNPFSKCRFYLLSLFPVSLISIMAQIKNSIGSHLR